jgi:tyrosinase
MQQNDGTRYQHVQEILRNAAGDGHPNHAGHGAFWDLPRDEFVALSIYGIELIPKAFRGTNGAGSSAGSSKGSCCHGEASTTQAAPADPCGPDRPSPKTAGLLKALRGESPFDGSHFPRMPMGRPPVADAGIAYIEQWIADGCPDEAHQPAAAVSIARATGAESFPRHPQPNSFYHETGQVKVRKNIENLTADELYALRCVFRKVKERSDHNRFDQTGYSYWADIHGFGCQHGWEQFLTWHRAYMYEFEKLLQDIIPAVTLPYWDWTMSIYKNGMDGEIPDAFKEKPAGGLSGFDVNPLWDANRFPGQYLKGQTLAGTYHHHYPTQEDIDEIQAIDNWLDYGGGPQSNQAFGALSMNPHNTIHIYCGLINNPDGSPRYSDMFNNLTAAYDPIFWIHHTNIDRLWSEWQHKNPGADPDDLDDVLAPFRYRVRDTLNITNFGYTYVNDAHVYPSGTNASITRFNADTVPVPERFVERNMRVHVKVHALLQPVKSFYVHLFLNQPDANAGTPVTDNPNYAGYAGVFGHGDCVGLPGHCDPPPGPREKFDLRGRHHMTPHNLRFHATKTAQRLARAGATTLQATVVPVTPDGEPITEDFRFQAVSIEFKD